MRKYARRATSEVRDCHTACCQGGARNPRREIAQTGATLSLAHRIAPPDRARATLESSPPAQAVSNAANASTVQIHGECGARARLACHADEDTIQ